MSAESAVVPAAPVPWYRDSPYLLFFPLGGLLSLLGVLPWVFFALGFGASWRPALHAITEIQSALTCFAIGFLFTFIPRRTKTARPSNLDVAIAIGLLCLTPLLALIRLEPAAHVSWAVLAFWMAGFVIRRIPHALRSGVGMAQLVWLPVSFLMGVGGSLMAALAATPGRPYWLGPMGTSLVWQGLMAGLAVGIGGMLLPMLLHREPHRGDPSGRAWLFHCTMALLFVASFGIEWAVGMRWGYGLRAAVTFLMLVVAARLWRWPKVVGIHRRIVWFAGWMIPLGFAAVCVWPQYRVGMLHLTLLSGFTLLTLSVANHVTIAHGGRDPLLFANPISLTVMVVAVALATAARILVAIDPAHLQRWIGTAVTLFLIALFAWAWWILPRLRSAPGKDPNAG